jgi:hypothetical protein
MGVCEGWGSSSPAHQGSRGQLCTCIAVSRSAMYLYDSQSRLAMYQSARYKSAIYLALSTG